MNRSISDDDICSSCRFCDYNPGERSSCEKDFPGETDEDGYVVECDFYAHPDDVELVKGVLLSSSDEDAAIYISDDHGEIVMWTYDEIAEDPSAWTASLRAVVLATMGRFDKIREIVQKPVN